MHHQGHEVLQTDATPSTSIHHKWRKEKAICRPTMDNLILYCLELNHCTNSGKEKNILLSFCQPIKGIEWSCFMEELHLNY